MESPALLSSAPPHSGWLLPACTLAAAARGLQGMPTLPGVPTWPLALAAQPHSTAVYWGARDLISTGQRPFLCREAYPPRVQGGDVGKGEDKVGDGAGGTEIKEDRKGRGKGEGTGMHSGGTIRTDAEKRGTEPCGGRQKGSLGNQEKTQIWGKRSESNRTKWTAGDRLSGGTSGKSA